MKYHTLFFRKLGKMSQNLPSAAVVSDASGEKSIAFSQRLNPFKKNEISYPHQLDRSISNVRVVG